jgi:carboxypeptidase Taq
MGAIKVLYTELTRILKDMDHLATAKKVLYYDMETAMPDKGAEARGKTMAYLDAKRHEMLVSPEMAQIVVSLKGAMDDGKLNTLQTAVVRHAWRAYNRAVKLPVDFVRETSEVSTATLHAWEKGKKAGDSGPVMPLLTKLVELKREEATLLSGENMSRYDALLDEFEPGMTTERVTKVFDQMKKFLIDFVRRIGESSDKPNPNIGLAYLEIERQEKLNRQIAELLGFDFSAGRLTRSTHPFTSRMHAGDTGITTRYDENDFYSSLSAVLHEAGHGMYEQGMPDDLFWTDAGQVPSCAIHESQSRLWENMVGRSRDFLQLLDTRFSWWNGLRGLNPDFYRAVNVVRPSLIRVDADEVTYNLHVCLRFELERDLIEGRLEVDGLRDAWNERMKEYLGLDVPGDFDGFLQDTHWPCGYFGYFPTYTIGNLYSAQIWNAVQRDLPDVSKRFWIGEFKPLLDWLRENIFVHAGMYDAEQIIRRATGSGLHVSDWMFYIEEKYSEIYGL